jgi:hypothetical protein
MKDDVTALVHAYLDGELIDRQRRELCDWLRQSPSNIDRFVAECRLHSELFDVHNGRWPAVESPSERGAVGCQPSFVADPSTFPGLAPIAVQDSLNPNSSMSALGGFFLSYAIAAVIVAIGMLIGWECQVSIPQAGDQGAAQLAQRSSALHPEPELVFVGRVTGMSDCRWADSKTGTVLLAYVPLNRKYALASGLMEISYDSGARVILEGPCDYEVQSKAGGSLSVGRLTARVQKKQGSATNQPSAIGNHQSPSPLFTVCTPTAIVTDLGTEFGVDASPAGVTETHVFSGTVQIEGRGKAANVPTRMLRAGQTVRLGARNGVGRIVAVATNKVRFIRKMPTAKTALLPDLIAEVDYSDTWSANSPTRAGSYLLMTTPESLRVENCHGNPQRSWVFSAPSAMTTWPYDNPPVLWPGFQVEGSRSGFTETGFGGTCFLGFEYGLRDDFIVQFDAVQTQDRINITIGNKPATISDERSLSVFFRAAGSRYPQIGLYTPSKGEVDAMIRSGIPTAIQWHNYAVRFNLLEKRLTVWVDRKLCGMIDLAKITQAMTGSGTSTWASLPWTARCVTVGGAPGNSEGRVWTDNFRVGAPQPAATSPAKVK